ncbi:MAG: DsrE family protein [Dehalococcoidales bacterium]|nr:DsrE family protein [Dehalococcoidales bacterium]
MVNREIVVVLRDGPLNSGRDEEGLRVAIGLTLANPQVTVLLLDQAVWLSVPLAVAEIERPSLGTNWETLGLMGIRRLSERESLIERGLDPTEVLAGVEVVSRAEAAGVLAEADVVLVY